jgi:hypothetical protein
VGDVRPPGGISRASSFATRYEASAEPAARLPSTQTWPGRTPTPPARGRTRSACRPLRCGAARSHSVAWMTPARAESRSGAAAMRAHPRNTTGEAPGPPQIGGGHPGLSVPLISRAAASLIAPTSERWGGRAGGGGAFTGASRFTMSRRRSSPGSGAGMQPTARVPVVKAEARAPVPLHEVHLRADRVVVVEREDLPRVRRDPPHGRDAPGAEAFDIVPMHDIRPEFRGPFCDA